MHWGIPIWRLAILGMAAASLGYYIAGTLAALRFFGRQRARSLGEFTPPVSILKPVKGLDFASAENYASFCELDYPEYEILFCVNDWSDPAVPLIEEIQRWYPERQIRLLSGAEKLGSNQKVNNLALLAREAKYEFLAQSDGDVRVPRNYLREVVAPFSDGQVGVVSCFYRSIAAKNFFAEIEAIGAASDFFAGAMVADWKEGVTFALGAAVMTTKGWLKKIGGYEGLASVLADDYEIGNRVHKAGGRVLLCRQPVWTMYPEQSAKSFWEHQVRWARTVRMCRPASYMGMLVTHGLAWAVLAAVVAPAWWMGAAYLASYLVLRLVMAWTAGVWGVGDEVLRKRMWMVPVRDAIFFAVWVASFASNRVKWGDTEYALKSGKMARVE